jgi:hypothetical protein
MKDWQLILTVLLAVGFLGWGIDRTGEKIIQRIKQLEAKIDASDSKPD